MIEVDWTIYIQAVNFLVLLIILHFLIFKPVLNGIKERDDYFGDLESKSKQSLESYNKLLQDYEESLKMLNKDVATLLSQAQVDAKNEQTKIILNAKEELETEVADAKKLLQIEVRTIAATLEKSKDQIAKSIAYKLARIS
ncbi:MAG: ATP synthase F0 subunit B [Nitrospinota bacterium]